jgi:tetratricopeptide (TPR) repeat protein
MVANSAEEGRAREAFDYAARLEPLAHAATDDKHPGSTGFYVVQIGGTRLRLAMRFAKWQEAIDHPVDFGIAEDQLPAGARALRDGMVIYARAMQSLEREDVDGGARAGDQLDALLWRFTRDQDQTDRTAHRVGEILGVASKELAGNVASARGDYRRAKELLQDAVEMEKKLGYSEPPLYSRPSLESLGYAAIRARDWETARNAFGQVLVLRPKSGFGYYGIALAYDKEGNRSAAAEAYQQFLTSWQHADDDLAMLRAGRAAMARLKAGLQ